MDSSLWRDKVLFTPGPLTTSRTVKETMLRDYGSRDKEFIDVVQKVRQDILELSRLDDSKYTTILLQGSGTMAVEAILGTAVPRVGGKLLICINGAYGRRMSEIADVLAIPHVDLAIPENSVFTPDMIAHALDSDADITHVGIIHSETSTGLMNPIEEIGAAVAKREKCFIVDAMSSFGASSIDMDSWGIHWLAASANKCLEGVPGLAFVVAARSALERCEENPRSLSLNLYAQNRYMEKCGQFRFTPPVQVVWALSRALDELRMEGGVEARKARYQANSLALRRGMAELGFQEYLAPKDQGYAIVSYHYPDDPAFSFEKFYDLLSATGHLIYPGKVAAADLFRIGTIGRLNQNDMRSLLAAIKEVLQVMGVNLPPVALNKE